MVSCQPCWVDVRSGACNTFAGNLCSNGSSTLASAKRQVHPEEDITNDDNIGFNWFAWRGRNHDPYAPPRSILVFWAHLWLCSRLYWDITHHAVPLHWSQPWKGGSMYLTKENPFFFCLLLPMAAGEKSLSPSYASSCLSRKTLVEDFPLQHYASRLGITDIFEFLRTSRTLQATSLRLRGLWQTAVTWTSKQTHR